MNSLDQFIRNYAIRARWGAEHKAQGNETLEQDHFGILKWDDLKPYVQDWLAVHFAANYVSLDLPDLVKAWPEMLETAILERAECIWIAGEEKMVKTRKLERQLLSEEGWSYDAERGWSSPAGEVYSNFSDVRDAYEASQSPTVECGLCHGAADGCPRCRGAGVIENPVLT